MAALTQRPFTPPPVTPPNALGEEPKEPVHGNPSDPLIERLVKWGRRRPALAGLAAISLLMGLAVGAGSVYVDIALQAERDIALQDSEEAERQRLAADKARELIDLLTASEAEAQEIAEEERIQAEAAREQARQEREKADTAREQTEKELRRAAESQRRLERAKATADAVRDEIESERRRAEASREQAEREKTQAEAARKLAETQAHRADIAKYAGQIGAADRALRDGNLGLASQVLTSSRREMRGWEFHYLASLIDRRLRSLGKHDRAVLALAFSPSGRRVTTIAADGTVKVSEVNSPAEALSCKSYKGEISAAAISPDGKRLALGVARLRDTHSMLPEVIIWDLLAGREILSLKGNSGSVLSIEFSGDGRRLASAGGDGIVKIWDAATGKAIFSLKGHTAPVRALSFSPDGKRLASAGGASNRSSPNFAGCEVKIWDVASGKQQLSLIGHTGAVNSLAFSPNGRHLASASDDSTLLVWDAKSGKVVHSLDAPGESIQNVAYDTPGKRLAAACGSALRIWDAEKGREIACLKGHAATVRAVAFSPDGNHLASAGKDKAVLLWATKPASNEINLQGHTNWVIGVCFSPDGQRAATSSLDRSVRIWDVATGQCLATLQGHASWVACVAFSPDGRHVASGSGDAVKEGKLVPGEIRVWNASTGKEHFTLTGHAGSIRGLAFSPDGQQLASAGADNTIKLWDVATAQNLLTIPKAEKAVAFTSDGKRLLGVSGKSLKAWDASTGQEVYSFDGRVDGVRNIVLSPDDRNVAGAGRDGSVKIWDVDSGREVYSINAHHSDVRALVFSPDGRRLATGDGGTPLGGADAGEVKIWDIATGEEVFSISGHGAAVRSLAFSPDGRRLACTGEDNSVTIWEANPEKRQRDQSATASK
ncbi:MAG: hypothetical protein ACJ8FY_01560 [Gemmataceae bacterium]